MLVSGEDLTPYRQASKKIQAVLQRFGTAERLGMDEIFLDVTHEARARLAQGRLPAGFLGHLQLGHEVHSCVLCTGSERLWRSQAQSGLQTS